MDTCSSKGAQIYTCTAQQMQNAQCSSTLKFATKCQAHRLHPLVRSQTYAASTKRQLPIRLQPEIPSAKAQNVLFMFIFG